MNETVTLPPPVIDLGPKSKWEREYAAFRRLFPSLLDTYRGQYVAIHNEQVVDHGDDVIALALRVYEKHGYVPIHIGWVSEQPERVERIPHYREIRQPGNSA